MKMLLQQQLSHEEQKAADTELMKIIIAWMEEERWIWEEHDNLIKFSREGGDARIEISAHCNIVHVHHHEFDIYEPNALQRIEDKARLIWHRDSTKGWYGPFYDEEKFCDKNCERYHLECLQCSKYDLPCWLCWEDLSMKLPHERCGKFVCEGVIINEEKREECDQICPSHTSCVDCDGPYQEDFDEDY
jgi:hypothetical protein